MMNFLNQQANCQQGMTRVERSKVMLFVGQASKISEWAGHSILARVIEGESVRGNCRKMSGKEGPVTLPRRPSELVG